MGNVKSIIGVVSTWKIKIYLSNYYCIFKIAAQLTKYTGKLF